MNEEHRIVIIDQDQVAAEVDPLTSQAADRLADFLTTAGHEFYRYRRPGEFTLWRFVA
ncbi:MAG: hypothetical protein QM809_01135 [Gordonia sp. (in: high G+C Gram-positive bacteria)]|uniref:hypothetical protein n=1 Tax=Gordonia sp. (in: high G+C Gram-positive bacteria) TaxID=84139 RepID=UPI0039E49687